MAMLLAVITMAGPFTGRWAGVAAPCAWFSLVLPAAVFARRLGWGIGGALMMPLVFPLLIYALLRSAAVTIRQGGVRWRDTFYSLEQLRAGDVIKMKKIKS